MCGILGSINQPFDENILNLILHRGPDDSGIVQIDHGDNSIYLGHRRLAIQDISAAGHQPMYSACRKFVMIFNGEIYNHYELREKLSGLDFKGHSDTETIVNYIAHFGIDAVKDFNGIFAFALLNIENHQLYLVRDRFGVKPLYFSQVADRFIFSSEIRPLKALLEPHVNVDNLALLLKLRFNPSPTTLYEAFHKLLPGHVLTIDLVTKSHTLCSFIQPIAINNHISFDDALEIYEKLLNKPLNDNY